MDEHVIIYYNDLIDSDNWVTAKFLQDAAQSLPSTRVIWIIEPRRVSLGRPVTAGTLGECTVLMEKSGLTDRPKGLKVAIGGLLTEERIAALAVKDLTKDNLVREHPNPLSPAPSAYLASSQLRLAIKPSYGPEGDAMLHSQLVALDFLAALQSWSGDQNGPESIFLHTEGMERLENPVNFNFHHHEELVNRSKAELEDYQDAMVKPYLERVTELRTWYRDCTQKHPARVAGTGKVLDLNFESLCNTIRNAKTVKYFGGCSLALLKRLMEVGTGDKMQCYMQAVSTAEFMGARRR